MKILTLSNVIYNFKDSFSRGFSIENLNIDFEQEGNRKIRTAVISEIKKIKILKLFNEKEWCSVHSDH